LLCLAGVGYAEPELLETRQKVEHMRRWITAPMLGLFLVAFGHGVAAFADDEGGDPPGHGHHGGHHHH